MSRLPFPETSSRGLAPTARRLRLARAAALLLATLGLWPTPQASAQERVLRFHHLLPEKSPQHQDIYLPWAKKIARASKGRLRIEVTGAMKLGGTPPPA